MGLLARVFGRRPPSRRAEAITLHAGELLEVVGESHRQDALRRVSTTATDSSPYLDELSGRARKIAEGEDRRRWFRAVLICEPDNEYDRNAIGVHADGVGLLGYLGRDDAIDYQPVFQALSARRCTVAACPAMLIGGEPGKPYYGVMLCLSSPSRVVQDLDETMPV